MKLIIIPSFERLSKNNFSQIKKLILQPLYILSLFIMRAVAVMFLFFKRKFVKLLML